MAKYKFGKRSLDRLKGVHPVIVEAFEAALAHEDCPHDIGFLKTEGFVLQRNNRDYLIKDGL